MGTDTFESPGPLWAWAAVVGLCLSSTLKLWVRRESAQDGFPRIRKGSGLECCHFSSQQPGRSSLIIPEESKQYPWCTGASGTGPPLAPYRAGWTRCQITLTGNAQIFVSWSLSTLWVRSLEIVFQYLNLRALENTHCLLTLPLQHSCECVYCRSQSAFQCRPSLQTERHKASINQSHQ